MGTIPKVEINLTSSAQSKVAGPNPRLANPVLARVLEDRKNHLRRSQPQDPYKFLKKTALESRVIIIEGISGSGKDTFQSYFRNLIEGRDIYDYSEGELMQSWKQLQIKGIFKLRINYMKLFTRFVKETIDQNAQATFLLNRFHLSTYASTIIHQPKLQEEYDEIINVLRTLPVHVFILRLDPDEMEERSLHPERSTTWQKYQKQIIKREGFGDTLQRHIWQQDLILQKAEGQQLPYSVIEIPASSAPEQDLFHVHESRNFLRATRRLSAANSKPTQQKNVQQEPF